MSWCSPCCSCCDGKDEKDLKDDKEKSVRKKRVYYKLPTSDSQEQTVVLPLFRKVPLEKLFHLEQPQAPVQVHPQLRKESIISEQVTDFFTIGPKLQPILERKASFEDSPFCSTPLFSSAPFDFGANLPRIDFIIFYDFLSLSFTVNLLEAHNLPPKDKGGTSDPFVTLFLLPHRENIFRTRTISKNLNPIFDETFNFNNLSYEEVQSRTLILRVLDEDTFSRDDLIGTVVLPLHKAQLHGSRVSAVLNENPVVGTVSK